MRHFTEQQVSVMRLALGLSGLPCNNAQAETVLHVTDQMETLGKKFSIKEACAIEGHIHRKYYGLKIKTESVKSKE